MGKIAFQVRLEELTHKKLSVIANNELRSLNAQLEYFIMQSIKDYETANGEIDIHQFQE